MASIGNLFLMVGAKHDQLDGGLRAIETKVGAAAARMKKLLSIPARIGAMPGTLGSPLTGALTSIPFLGGALAAGLGGAGLVGALKHQMDEMVEIGREAKRFGVSTEYLVGIQRLAGASSEALSHGLNHLWRELGQASGGSVEARSKFRGLGLDVEALIKLPADERLGQIADTIKALPDPMQQAAMAFELFGKAGGDMLPFLLKGSASMKDSAEQAKLMGLSFSQLDAENVARANKAMKEITGTVEGILRQGAIGLAPYLEGASKLLTDFIKQSGGVPAVMDKIMNAVYAMFRSIAEVALIAKEAVLDLKKGKHDVAEDAALAFLPGQALWRSGPKVKGGMSALERNRFQEIMGRAPVGNKTVNDQLADMDAEFERLKKGVAPTTGNGPAGPTPQQIAIANAIDDLNKGLEHQIATLGLSANSLKLWDLQQLGATDAALAFTRALAAQADRQQATADVLNKAFGQMGIGERFRQSLAAGLAPLHELELARDKALAEKKWELRIKGVSELERLKEQLEDLRDTGLKGIPDLLGIGGGRLAAGGVLDILNDFEGKHGLGGEVKLPGAAEAGSSEAVSAMNRFMAQGTQPQDAAARWQRTLDFMQQSDGRRDELLREIVKAFREGKIQVGGVRL